MITLDHPMLTRWRQAVADSDNEKNFLETEV